MATGVTLSPKRPVMDSLEKTSASGAIDRKTKGIHDFFPTVPRTSAPKDVSQKCKSKGHAETVSNGKNGSDCKKDSGTTSGKHSVLSTRNDEETCSTVTVDLTDSASEAQQDNAIVAATSADGIQVKTKVSAASKKKKSLATNRKTKSNRDTVISDTESSMKEQKDASQNDGGKSLPQEMDYEEFVKTLTSAQDGDCSAASNKDTVHPDSKTIQSSTEHINVEKQPSIVKSRAKSSPSMKEDSLEYQKKTKSNAFTLLMQARHDKKKEISSEDTHSNEKDDDVNFPGETLCITESDIDKTSTETTPSVLNFFSRCTKDTAQENNGGGPVIVQVDVHHNPFDRKTTPTRRKCKKFSLKEKEVTTADPNTEDEIVFLGSETVEVEFEDKKLKSKKGNDESKTSFMKLGGVSSKTEDSETKCGKTDQLTVAKRNAFLQDSSSPQEQSMKTAQATLQFGKSGKLAMNTSVLAKSAKKQSNANCDKVENPVETTQGKCTRARRNKTKQKIESCDSYDDDDHSINDTTSEKQGEKKSPPRKAKKHTKDTQSRMLTRLGKTVDSTSDNDASDFTPKSKGLLADNTSESRAYKLLMRSRQKRKCSSASLLNNASGAVNTKDQSDRKQADAAKENSEEKEAAPTKGQAEETSDSNPEQGSRRQSRRLAELQKAKQAAEEQSFIRVDSDSSSEEDPTPRKKRAKTKDSSQGTSKSASPRRSPKKTAGKLAPIFAKKGEAVDKTPQQVPEDPEVVRRRREFLLSGVPSELKRQSANTDLVLTASEFIPFPECNHVQQKTSGEPGNLDVWSMRNPEKLKLLLKDECTLGEMGSSDFQWSNLHWQPIVPELNRPAASKATDLPNNNVSQKVQEMLLKDLQQTDPDFPFSTLFDKFREQLKAATTKQVTVTEGPDKPGAKRPSTDSDIVIVDEDEDTAATQTERDCQWPESLQPKCASEIIGNENSIRRLKYWLEEWKILIQREAKLTARSAAGNEDSDFEFSGGDSEEESSQLCNTMLLMGPHGVGKTAAVYALAHQLSYKVFEVNASSPRQGRHILAKLQEATQSHQVAQKKDGIILSPLSAGPPSQATHTTEQVEEKKRTKKNEVPKAFANFFKKSDNAFDNKTAAKKNNAKRDSSAKSKDNSKEDKTKKVLASPVKEGGRKRRRGAKEAEVAEKIPCLKTQHSEHGKSKRMQTVDGDVKEGEESNLAGCLNLTSTSLILFDEVDLVFEEDVGFLQTVQHFINTTKIPIVMTSSDPGFKRRLNSRFETLTFKVPPAMPMTSFLQTACLAVGKRTCREDIRAVADLCRGDVRHVLLTLQFWALSGGSRTKKPQAIVLKPTEQTSSKETKQNKETLPTSKLGMSSVADEGDSDEDFVCLKPVRKKSRRIVDDDDSNRAVPTNVGSNSGLKEQCAKETADADTLPPVHLNLYESVLTVPCDLHSLLMKCLQDEYNYSQVQRLARECLKLKTSELDIVQTNILHFLPLPKTTMPGRWQAPSSSVKRKRIRCDIYDSEASGDEDSSMQTADSQDKQDGKESADSTEALQEDISKNNVEATSELTTKVTGGEELKTDEHATVEENQSEEKNMEIDTSTDAVGSNKSCGRVEETNTGNIAEADSTKKEMNYSLKGSKKCTDHGLGSKLLCSFARYYDSLSSGDSAVCNCSNPHTVGKDRFHLLPGIDDCAASEQESFWDRQRDEIAAEVDVRSARRLWQCVDKHVSEWRKQSDLDSLPEDCHLPLTSPDRCGLLIRGDNSTVSVPDIYTNMTKTVTKSLPLTTYNNHNAIALDYLPALRSISRAEQCRQIAGTKRRFHHHFKNIGLYLNPATVTALCADFPAEQQNS